MLQSKQFIFGVLYYTVVSLCIILFASPLFRVIGFEYATIISLASSIHLLFFVAEKAAASPKRKFAQTLQNIYQPAVIFTLVPFCIGIINGLIISQCDLLLGTLMYFQVVIPTAIIAVLFGIHFGWMNERPLHRRLWVSAFWMVTFIISLLPGYFNPQIFTYGWQYGFFPGFIWDPAIELQSAYWWSRLFVVLLALSILIEDNKFIKVGATTWREKVKTRLSNFWSIGIFNGIIAFIYLVLLSPTDIIQSHDRVNKELRKYILVENGVFIHFTDSTFTPDEKTILQYRCSMYCDSVYSFYGIKEKRLIDLYIYSSEEEMKKYVGTANASIAKPWLNELHIAKENLGSLKHELVHTVLAPYGSFPFDISWSTGLTEGAAVAVEENYDGIRNCDEYSARILQLGLAKGIKDIMSFSGFAAEASSKSYTLAGSFSKYLIKTYGSGKFLNLYGSREYDKVYGKSIDVLEREWISSLKPLQTSMDRYDSLRVRFYFDRTSIINEPCLRRIGRMMKQADEYFADSIYQEADALYSEVLQESDRLDAIHGRVLSHLRMNNPKAALAILDTTSAAKSGRNSTALHNLRGDCIFLATGDTVKAKAEWAEAMKLELSDKSVTSAFIRYYYIIRLEPSKIEEVYKFIYHNKDIEDHMLVEMRDKGFGYDDNFEIASSALLFNAYQSMGRMMDALVPGYIADSYLINKADSLSRPALIVAKRLASYYHEAHTLFK
jgi:hypothetical protein